LEGEAGQQRKRSNVAELHRHLVKIAYSGAIDQTSGIVGTMFANAPIVPTVVEVYRERIYMSDIRGRPRTSKENRTARLLAPFSAGK